MELKLKPENDETITQMVLIVPYGIETNHGVLYPDTTLVLIVPYGIETTLNGYCQVTKCLS